jgi:hypothetical protein
MGRATYNVQAKLQEQCEAERKKLPLDLACLIFMMVTAVTVSSFLFNSISNLLVDGIKFLQIINRGY